MKFYDFEYDGLKLSDLGYMVCDFGSKGLETIENGVDINFNTVSTHYGAKHELINTSYSNYLTTTFQICKNPCLGSGEKISVEEFGNLVSWLNRRGFHKFKIINDEYSDIFFEASFNIKRIEFAGEIYGLELSMITNRPYALKEPITIQKSLSNGESIIIDDLSNEEGFIYPYMKITLKGGGTLSINNSLSGETTVVKNCSIYEYLYFEYPVIRTSSSSHKIQNDFNWVFPKIINKFQERTNEFTFSLACNAEISYSPIFKIGI